MKRSITTFTTTSKYTKQDRALRRNKHYLILTEFVLGESQKLYLENGLVLMN